MQAGWMTHGHAGAMQEAADLQAQPGGYLGWVAIWVGSKMHDWMGDI